ncbi:MAG: UTP--glucose-1-phosphate uridylyltransferase [Patescibacteria group bacterium]
MPQKIRKLIIPVAGFGTRFLPVTKALPKEMLPIVDKPILQYIVEEAVASGIEDIIVVTSFNKRAVEDHFDYMPELEAWLARQGKTEALEQVKKIAELANFVYIRQKGPYGNGTPILNAKHLINNEPFAVIFGDDLMLGPRPHLQQLIEVYEQYEQPVITAYKVDDEGTKNYGIIEAEPISDRVYKVKSVVEKPGPVAAPSRLASISGYILTPEIFTELENTPLGKNGELWLPDAINQLLSKKPIYACLVDGIYYDMGSKLRWLEANVDLALKDPELKDEFRDYLKQII